jgi:osmoprotectant transport system permease protein
MSRLSRYFLTVALTVSLSGCQTSAWLRLGSKADNETTILAEMVAQVAQSLGVEVEFRRKLGGTPVLWKALLAGEIDCYPEYTGTLRQQIFKNPQLTDDDLRAELARLGIGISEPLGFANNYALGMQASVAQRLGVQRISQLRQHQDLVFGFSPEFLNREDGWPGLQARYGLPQRDVRSIDHQVAYKALAAGELAVTDLYTTDAEIERFNLIALEDDDRYFPAYQAVFLYRLATAAKLPDFFAQLKQFEGKLSESDMIRLNSQAQSGLAEEVVAAEFVRERFGISSTATQQSTVAYLGRLTLQHLKLVGISLVAAVVVAVPLGIVAAQSRRLGQALLAVTGVIQTIPSLALLVFMIPLPLVGGIGQRPAIVALFLYSLLPIVRNTYTGLRDIPRSLRESAESLGLSGRAQLWQIELPLASRTILAGIKTAAVINVGTATLGAFIGAGGYGEVIMAGVQLQDTGKILLGAVPAATLALLVQGLFELVERLAVPRGLRLPRQE